MHTLFLHITKGGTGKSLSTCRLAWLMGELFEKRVLVVDLDPQANISFLLGVNGNDIINSGAIIIGETPQDTIQKAKELIVLLPNYELQPQKYGFECCNKFNKCKTKEIY